MVLTKRKKTLLAGGLVLLIIVLIGGIFAASSFRKSEAPLTEAEILDQQLESASRSGQEVSRQIGEDQEKKVKEYTSKINTVDDLKALEESEQGSAGIIVINKLIADQKANDAQPFIDYVMTLQTGYGLEASKLCYITATDDGRKSECIKVMTSRAVEQGIIKSGEQLPAGYYEQNTEEAG